MNPFDTYPFDFSTYYALKTIQGVVDWVTGNTPITVTSAAKDRIDAIDQKHHIPVTVATCKVITGDRNHTYYVCTPVPEEDQVGKLAVLQKELSKMPAAALQKIKIKDIILCGTMEKRLNMGFLPDSTDVLSGLSNTASHTIYLSGAHVFHHELFHVMWGQSDACGDNILDGCQDRDEEWNALEPNKSFIDANEDRPNYAMFLFNLDTKDGQERYDTMMQEPGLCAKMAKVKNWLRFVDPRLDEKFWGDLRSGKVDLNYWSRQK